MKIVSAILYILFILTGITALIISNDILTHILGISVITVFSLLLLMDFSDE